MRDAMLGGMFPRAICMTGAEIPVAHTPIEGPAVWQGPLIDYRTEGMHVLSADEIAEIDAALRHLRALGEVDFPDITPARFPLPALGTVLGRLGHDLRYGRGFLLLRGLPRDRYALHHLPPTYFLLAPYLRLP